MAQTDILRNIETKRFLCYDHVRATARSRIEKRIIGEGDSLIELNRKITVRIEDNTEDLAKTAIVVNTSIIDFWLRLDQNKNIKAT